MTKSKFPVSCKTLDIFIEDERKVAKKYKDLGFDLLARDEQSHIEFFKAIKKSRCNRDTGVGARMNKYIIYIIFIIMMILFNGMVQASCVSLTDAINISVNTTLCTNGYYINGTGTYVIRVLGSNIYIDGNGSSLIGNGNGTAIYIEQNRHDTKIRNFNIINYTTGINIIYNINGTQIYNNNFDTFDSYGIQVRRANNISIYNNTFTNYQAICTLSNIVYRCLTDGVGVLVYDGAYESQLNKDIHIENNSFNKIYQGIKIWNGSYISIKNNSFVDGSDGAAIFAEYQSVHDVTIDSNYIFNQTAPIVYYGNNATIFNNDVCGHHHHGISTTDTNGWSIQNVNIYGNTIDACDFQDYLYSEYSNAIAHIYVGGARNVDVHNNTLIDGWVELGDNYNRNQTTNITFRDNNLITSLRQSIQYLFRIGTNASVYNNTIDHDYTAYRGTYLIKNQNLGAYKNINVSIYDNTYVTAQPNVSITATESIVFFNETKVHKITFPNSKVLNLTASDRKHLIITNITALITSTCGVAEYNITQDKEIACSLEANCLPYDNVLITSDQVICSGTYQINDSAGDGAIQIPVDDIILDFNNSELIGNDDGWAVYSYTQDNITIKNGNINRYKYGIFTNIVSNLNISGMSLKENYLNLFIERSNVGQSYIQHNTINMTSNPTIGSYSTNIMGIYATNIANITIEDNTIYSSVKGYMIDILNGTALPKLHDIKTQYNTLYPGNYSNGIVYGNGIYNSSIVGNNITGIINRTGIALQNTFNVLVDSNYIHSTEATSTLGDCIQMSFDIDNVTISNNDFGNCDRYQIRVGGNNINITDNTYSSTSKIGVLVNSDATINESPDTMTITTPSTGKIKLLGAGRKDMTITNNTWTYRSTYSSLFNSSRATPYTGITSQTIGSGQRVFVFKFATNKHIPSSIATGITDVSYTSSANQLLWTQAGTGTATITNMTFSLAPSYQIIKNGGTIGFSSLLTYPVTPAGSYSFVGRPNYQMSSNTRIIVTSIGIMIGLVVLGAIMVPLFASGAFTPAFIITIFLVTIIGVIILQVLQQFL